MTYLDLSTVPFRALSPSLVPETVLALGNFDGVHIGHRTLLGEAVRKARELGIAPSVWLFRSPPTDFLKTPPPPHLSTLEDKLLLFKTLGIRFAFIEDFEAIGGISPDAFAKDILQGACRCRHAVCGFNYSFGYRGAGTPMLLSTLFDGAVSVISPVTVGDLPVSSTRIRTLLLEGDAEKASELLGRPYSFKAPVLHGKALGRTIDFPTVNQDFPPLTVIPKPGIYAVTVRISEDHRRGILYGVSNVGKRPTVEDSGHINCETFILDFDGDLYGKELEIGFVTRLRDERKMSSIDELRAAIQADANTARRIFRLTK
ncbi:MAG: riboflavin biosynthesis protein RibF [Clostridia bacterium]|nr:riboflavin biosynthesis protein RibF [Clostridia bacterium]